MKFSRKNIFKLLFYTLIISTIITIFLKCTKSSLLLNRSNNKYHQNSNDKLSNKILNEYIKIHELNLMKRDNTERKLVFSSRIKPGYANKIYSILSSLTIAILTDSALIIDWPEIHKYIRTPLKNVFNTYDTNSELNYNYKNGAKNFYISMGNSNTWKQNKSLNLLINTKLPKDKNRIVFRSNYAYFFELCSNPIYYDKLLFYKLVDYETINQARLVYQNLNFNKKHQLDKLLDVFLNIGFQVGSNLLNNFWHLEENLLNDINQVYKKEFENNYVIGIQMRFEFLDAKLDLDKFIQCAFEIEKNLFNNKKNIKWFISSDTNWIFKKLKEMYSNKIIEGNGPIGHTGRNLDSYYRTLFDNELLSRSNEIIITGGSTFGFVAAMKNGNLPFFIEGKRFNQNFECKRMSFSRLPRSPSGNALF